jgi:diketogulonate reductase-like aldo/keto reductase
LTTRRGFLQSSVAAAGLLAMTRGSAFAADGGLITRAIPKSGERLPIVGLGSSATFAQVARSEDVAALKAVFETLVKLGGRVFDTAPQYGASEEVAGRLVQELGLGKQLFWATKLNVAPKGGSADPALARKQLETSFARIGKPVIDLVQVHNMGDIKTQLPILREYKEKGRIRYIGVTTTFENQYAQLIDAMRTEIVDFIGTDYAIDNRDAEQTLPDWAAEFGAATWAQFFLKFVASHPSVTCITPATSRDKNMVDNMGGALGKLPDAALKKRMIDLIDALPSA